MSGDPPRRIGPGPRRCAASSGGVKVGARRADPPAQSAVKGPSTVPTLNEQLSGIAPWRRAVTIALFVAAFAVFVLAVAGVIQTAAVVGAVVVIAGSYLVGPRSPFFRSGTA